MNTKEKAARPEPETALKSQHAKHSIPEFRTVKGRVLVALLQGWRLTHKDVWLEFGSSRASHHIYSLRKDGWPIIPDLVDVATSDHGRRAIIAVYRLPSSQLGNVR